MQRRDFSKHLAVTGVGLGLGLASAGAARAQGLPVEGKDYARLRTPQPLTLPSPQKKIEVIEFFWYGCPHCFAFEPGLEAWEKTLAPDVYFHPLPFAFIGAPEQQKLFYTLEDMGLLPTMHDKVFNAIHVQYKRLDTEAEITDFMAANGVDRAKFTSVFRSFDVATKVNRGKQISSAWGIDGVPTLGVQGRWYTSPAQANSQERALQVASYLIGRARQGA
ncbi:MAG: thiol:disulfide interchange protein DsbA/DsbL [Burkholderiales bacterium]|nr:thiol:disulfide interchange protein DsbA/DsbL [Burkholderiales bacterium]